MADNPVSWFEIYVQDMPRARKFYESTLEVKLELLNPATPELWRFPQSNTSYGSSGALAKAPGMASGGNSTLVYFFCPDCGLAAKRAAAAGGRILRDKVSIGEYGFVAHAYDTEGNLFGLHSMR